MKNCLPQYMTNQDCRRWLLWKFVPVPNKKPKKVPYYTNGIIRNGKLDTPEDLAHLATFDKAYKVLQTSGFSGLGFALGADGKGEYWQGIDLDDLSEHPELQSLALPGYVERSPCKDGLHAIGYGRLFPSLASNNSGTEAYSRGRYFTVTGDAIGIAPQEIVDLANYVRTVIEPLHNAYSKKKSTISFPVSPNKMTPGIDVTPDLINDLRSALTFIDSDEYGTWIGIGHALYKLGSPGYELWAEWSAKSYMFEGNTDLARWDSFKGDHTSYRTVFSLAQKNGWDNPKKRKWDSLSEENLSLSSEVKPIPLTEGLPEVMSWDSELAPPSLRGYIQDIAERTQCPADFVGVALIIGIGSIVGRKFNIYPKQNDDWTVVPNQWGCIIGKPSAMKSPALKLALHPLHVLETEAREQHKIKLREHKAFECILKMERKNSEKKAEKLLKNNNKVEAIQTVTETIEDLEEPTPFRYIVNDTTVEKLGELLNQNPNGLLLLRDELYGWLSSMQMEENAKDRAFYLECFDGNGSFTYDRIVRGTIHIESCCLSLVGGIQPSRIAPLVKGALNGKMDDGLVQRLQLAVWPDDNKNWELIDKFPNQVEKEKVDMIIKTLNEITNDPCKILRFTPIAQVKFNSWYTALMKSIREGEVHSAMQSHLMKMPQTIAGLALLFELIEGGHESVGEEAIDRALQWAWYLQTHANRLYTSAIRAPIIGARLILERQNKLPSPFTAREVVQKSWSGLPTTEVVNEALEVLVDHNYITKIEIKNSAGGRSSAKYGWIETDNK